ncbi:tyrosine-type recombinase/integrase [Thermomonas brevis]|uniref:Tyrosine-type recombinase/integrase n=1 Tax=Thermomonas brevis TaxID=215691 RepID=A0A7G9QVN4_9GAMM|nr:tyrosine-type recombinase/integrase [Thermomonas brevis]QNN47409.1 tyrosine-type recombinase/integrase [Thermomonas brevis]
MRLPRYLLLRPSGYTFRLVVPKHLRRHFDGRGEIRRSLRTHDPRLALAWSGALLLAYHAAIARVEKTGMVWRKNDDDELAQALGLTGGRKPKDWKVVHPSGAYHEGPDTDDKAADMAAAKEAAKFLAELYGGAGPLGPPGQRPASMTLPTPPPPGPPPGVKTFSTGAAVSAWLNAERPNFTTPARKKTFGKLKKTGDTFAVLVKPGSRLYTLGRSDCGGFYDHLMAGGLSRKSAQSVQSYLKRFFTWATAHGYYPEDKANPAAGHIRLTRADKASRRGTGFQAFKVEQLRAMFAPEAFAALPTLKDRWMAVLALYTGARSNELARLELVDVGPDEHEGVPVLDINELAEDKSLKAEASIRLVPIHPDLQALGLLERVEARKAAGEARLFPGNLLTQNGPAASSQKAFLAALKAWGIAPRGKGRMGLHSFRATVIQRMTTKGVAQGWRELFVGHEVSEKPSTLDGDHMDTYNRDEKGRRLTPLKATAAACLPALNWAAEGVIDLDGLRPLLAAGAAPEQATSGRRKKATV